MGIINLIETSFLTDIEAISSFIITLGFFLFAAIDEAIALILIFCANLILGGIFYIYGMNFIIPIAVSLICLSMLTMLLYGKLNNTQVV